MISPKQSLKSMKPYIPNSQKFKLKLDANEGKNYLLDKNSLSGLFEEILSKEELNLYPDSEASALKLALAKYYGFESENLVLGNGSSEMIHLLFSTYCEKDDIILTFSPNFSMYDVYSKICDAKLEKLNTLSDFFEQDMELLIKRAHDLNPKIILLCNPNNPTGSIIPVSEIEKVILNFPDTLIAVDEAYADFSDVSALELVKKYKNILVLRTMSKAFGLADLRIGLIIADDNLVSQLQATKAPYNLNGISQAMALYALKNSERISTYISEVNQERESLNEFLKVISESGSIGDKLKVYPSQTNFLFVKCEVLNLAEKLAEKSIAIRDFSKEIEAHYRISVGDKTENNILKAALNDIFKKYYKSEEMQYE